MCLSVTTLNASISKNEHVVVFKCCYNRGSHQGKHNRSLVPPIYGFLNGSKLVLENCMGGYVRVVVNGIVYYESVIPDDLEIELPNEIVGSFDVFVIYNDVVYKAVLIF